VISVKAVLTPNRVFVKVFDLTAGSLCACLQHDQGNKHKEGQTDQNET